MKKIGALTLLTAALSLALAQVAFAHEGPHTFHANLTSLNGSGDSGTATVKVSGNRLTVDVETTGVSPNLPHAQHIHIGGQNVCPTAAADKNGDGFVSTVEGQPSYGPIKVALTTKGDVSMKSGGAADRFPVASADGTVSYSRTFALPSGVSPKDVANGVVVQHGISELFANQAKYDGAKKSSMDPSLPFESTVPASCGKLVPVTMPDTGGVSPISLALAAGAALTSLGAATLYLARRRTA